MEFKTQEAKNTALNSNQEISTQVWDTLLASTGLMLLTGEMWLAESACDGYWKD